MKHDSSDNVPEETSRVFKEFDCPSCDANNPWDDGFTYGGEIRCHYCGCEYEVSQGSGKSKLKLVEI
ncbi:MAG: hypothetical protein GY822_29385 [Deltaproteobacteria bacterium]|nr:hypothetical protein [Deltaproteobacteria bacterium]